MATATATGTRLDLYRQIAQQLRRDSIRCSTAAGSGHPTSSLSAADVLAVLLAGHLRYDWSKPKDLANDHLIFSKGHASPLVYAVFRAAGVIDDKELVTFRKSGSRLQGHPTPVLPWVDVATGSLGQGMPIAIGMALAAKRLWHAPFHVWTLLGDSETAEGSVWEGFDLGGFEGLNNVTPIIDVNRLGQRGPTELQWDTDAYAARIEAFGWDVLEIDGHELAEIDDALSKARDASRPTAIVARTIKGKGVSFVEDKEGWHGKALSADEAKKALAELGGDIPSESFPTSKPDPWSPPAAAAKTPQLKTYTDPVATRKAYGDALAAVVAARGDVVALDAEVSNSTHSEEVKKVAPERFFEMYIAEQKMVASAVGMQVIGLRPFASTFAAFFTRAYDFIRMAAISQANIRLSGSHAGVSIGEDGPSQMALEDLAMMRAVHGSTVLYPCDGNQTAKLVAAMADRDGIVYLRTTRANTPVIYSASESFPIGGSKVVRSSADDKVTIVTAGITVHEAIKAADALANENVKVRVVDAYSVKPIDAKTLAAAVGATGGRLVVVEDHWPEGGLGEAVLSALAGAKLSLRHLAVIDMPASGKPAELLHAAGIDADGIEKAVRSLL